LIRLANKATGSQLARLQTAYHKNEILFEQTRRDPLYGGRGVVRVTGKRISSYRAQRKWHGTINFQPSAGESQELRFLNSVLVKG
jgi:hypothetical protein